MTVSCEHKIKYKSTIYFCGRGLILTDVRVGTVKTLETGIKLISWEFNGDVSWSVTLRDLTDLLDISYRPKQLLVRVDSENYYKIKRQNFNKVSMWDYEEIFDSKSEYLINTTGIIELISTSKKDEARIILKYILESIKSI